MVATVETYYQDGKWHNKIAGESEPVRSHPNEAEALAQGSALAMYRAIQLGGTCTHIIRDKGGKVIAQDTYPLATGSPGLDPP